MGRALFSLSYATPDPAVRTEPEPEVEPYGRWSIWNRFDPDSDEFFQDAEYEAFVDPVNIDIQRQHAIGLLEPTTDSERTAESSESDDSSDGGLASPVVPSSEIPVVLGGRIYNNRSLPRTYTRDPRLGWSDVSSTSLLPVHSPVIPQSPDTLDNPPFIPPLSFREPTPDIEEQRNRIDPPPSLPLRRTVNIIPIDASRIQIMPATRSPFPESLPMTPPPQATPLSLQSQMLTPSPPPTATPRFYSWQNHPIPALPTSPTIIRGSVFTRRETPSAIHVPSAVV